MIWLILLFLSLFQVIIIGKILLLENRTPEKTILWLIIIILPILGFIIYYVLGRKTRGHLFKHKHFDKHQINLHLAQIAHQQKEPDQEGKLSFCLSESEEKLTKLLLSCSNALLSVNNQVEILLNGGEKFKELFTALEGATHHIHLSYFIFKDDEIGEDVMKILSRKVVEGVEVRVILDGMGSHSVSGSFMRSMQQSGIQAEWFFPIRFPYLTSKLNLRYHRKIVVADGRIGFMGGLNIGDEYLSRDSKMGFWRDTHLRIEGDAVHSLQTIFLNDWFLVTHQKIQGRQYFPQSKVEDTLPIQIVACGPDSEWASIQQGLLTAISLAKHRVYVETPYLIPNESLIMALTTSALSGLDVQLVVQGIPDHKLEYWASHSYYEELLQAGVKIFEYLKGTLHAKVIFIDDWLASVGSANLNNRSFNLDFEINAFLYDHDVVENLLLQFQQDISDSSEFCQKVFQTRPLLIRYQESIARLFSPIL